MHRIEKDALFLIDGSYLLYRSYYAMRPLYTSKGVPTQAVYGFCRAFNKLIKQFDPTKVVLVWDSKGPTFRSKVYAEYKATRQKAPSDLFGQKEKIQEFADAIGLCQTEKVGYEADDLIGSLVKDNKNKQSVIVGVDKDLYQLLSKDVLIFDPFKDLVIDKHEFEKEKGFAVEKLPFYYSLLGDASDNIPGVKGIGKIWAKKLVTKFKSLDDLYKNLEKVKPVGIQKKLEEEKDNAYLSLELFQLKYYKLKLSEKDKKFDKDNYVNAAPLFKELEFGSLLKDIEKRFNIKIDQVVKKKKRSKIGKEKNLSIFRESEEEEVQDEIVKVGGKTAWKCITIKTKDGLKSLISKIKKKKIFALDTETSGLKPMQDKLVGLSFALDNKVGYYLPIGHTGEGFEQQLEKKKAFDLLKPVLENSRIKKILHNAKFDKLFVWKQGIELDGIDFDTLIVASLLRKEWNKINLKALSKQYLNEEMKTFKDVLGKKYKDFRQIPVDTAAEYAAHDALQTFKLKFVLEKILNKEKKIKKLYENLEFPLNQVLFEMEKVGMLVDVSVLKDVEKKVNAALKRIKDKIYASIKSSRKLNVSSKKITSKGINLNSPQQVEKLLFDQLKLPVVKKSGKGKRSTDQEVLLKLSELHPIPGMIMKYRELHKLKSTYLEPLSKVVNPETGRIHTSFNQVLVATGRLSSSEPNLQNIPASADYGVAIRSAFVAPKGKRLMSADYSQMELRVLAHITKDKNLLSAFKQDLDIHAQTAAQLFDVKINKVTQEQRQIGKRINFSIIYGLTPYGLAKDLNIKPSEAKTYIEKYFEQYQGVAKWIDQTVKDATKNGFVETLMGRRRYISGLKERNKHLWEAAKRIAVNTPVQGTSAEIMKKAMLDLYNAFVKKRINADIVLQIHDELIIEFDSKQEKNTEKLVRKNMENVVSWGVPFKVSIRTGRNWGKITK